MSKKPCHTRTTKPSRLHVPHSTQCLKKSYAQNTQMSYAMRSHRACLQFASWMTAVSLNTASHSNHITPEGVTVLPSKVNAVQGWPAPTDLKSLRQFLGLTGFYRHFVPQYGTVAAPLTDLLQSSTPWHWSSRQQSAFDSLKVALCAAPVLCFPDPEKPFVVGTDASDYAVGAVLQQDHGRGLQPVAYLSRKLFPADTVSNRGQPSIPRHQQSTLLR